VSAESEKQGAWAQMSVSVAGWAICTQQCVFSNLQHLKPPQVSDKKRWYIPVDPVTMVQCVRRRNCLSILCRGNFSVLKNCQDPVVLLFSMYRWLFVHPKVKWAGPGAAHLHLMTISRVRGVVPPPQNTLHKVHYFTDFELWRRRTSGRFTLCSGSGES